MARCAHFNPLRPFCDSTKFPQKPAATRIAVTGAAACARLTLWATRVAQSTIACWEKGGRPVPGANLREFQADLMELAAWRQIAQDPAGFEASLQVCPGAAADLAAERATPDGPIAEFCANCMRRRQSAPDGDKCA